MEAKIIIWESDEYKVDLDAPAGERVLIKDGDNFVTRVGLDKLLDIILFEGVPKFQNGQEKKEKIPEKINIYLDVEGTILDINLKPADYLKEFLEIALEKHNVFWLTTHCKDDNQFQQLINYLKTFFTVEYLELFKRVKPTNWQTLKTEAIDFSKEFLWLDDFLLEQEKKELEKQGKLGSWIKIDLLKNPSQFLHIMKTII